MTALNTSVQGRREDIDTIRAIACIALVSYHVVGSSGSAGLHLADEHLLSRLNQTFADMRMPLFSFISGYVFVVAAQGRGEGRTEARSAASLLGGKARRLLVPMLAVGALFWALRTALIGAQGPLWQIAVLPYAHFWYLQATFLLMAVLIGAAALLRDTGGRAGGQTGSVSAQERCVALALFVVVTALWVIGTRAQVNLFSVNNALYIGPFFFAGFILARSPRAKTALMGGGAMRRGAGGAIVTLAVLVGAALAFDWVEVQGPARRVLTLALGAAACSGLLLLRPVSAWLAKLGRASYAVYLFHVFFTAGTRMVLMRLWPEVDVAVIWALALVAGLLGPMAVQAAVFAAPHFLARPLALACFGVRIRPEGRARPAAGQAERRVPAPA